MASLRSNWHAVLFALGVVAFGGWFFLAPPYLFATVYENVVHADYGNPVPVLNTRDYNFRMLALSHVNVASTTFGLQATELAALTASAATTTPSLLMATVTASTSVRVEGKAWPVSTVYPEVGALLPFNRIIAYYGNFYSTKMGVLGEYPPEQMIAMLASTTAAWTAADPSTPAIPAIDYIAVTAQGSAGFDGKYRARMPGTEIQKAVDLADQVNGIVILDVQVGLSTLQDELPLLEPYLKLPNVHLAIDPEFSMKNGTPPGRVIGTMDATDVNYAARYLASLVQANHLPPKILVVHRFTGAMVTNVGKITPLPEVQIVMDMDGFGTQRLKRGTYAHVITQEPVQFSGLKLFYKNDIPPRGDAMLTPAQIIGLLPTPLFIQYQ